MQIAVFRTADDGHRTAQRLATLGHTAVVAPVLAIAPTRCPLPDLVPNAVIFTSAHGVECVAADKELSRIQPTACYCVGSRTADRARALGFRDVRDGRADAKKLASLIQSGVERGGTLLLICGHDRKPLIEETLTASGYVVTTVEVYRAVPKPPWGAPIVAALADQHTCGALHYSQRSADLALGQAEAAGLSAAFLALRHYCLSEDAAVPIRRAGAKSVFVADHPDEQTLLALL